MGDEDFARRAQVAGSYAALDEIYESSLRAAVNPREHHIPPELQRTGRFGGGIANDIRRRLPFYGSDFKDGFNAKAVASIFFLFFACLAPAVAFGGLLAVLTNGSIGAVEMIVATAVCGVTYALFSGQPLTILGSTGPVIIFMGILYALTERLGIPYMPTLAWVGFWTSGMLLVLAFTDASSLIRYFTRFTDDTFAALISLIFIYEALSDIQKVFTGHEVSYATALLSLVLSLGTYGLARSLGRFRRSVYLRRRLREFVADFGPAIAIATMTGVAFLLHEVELETLAVPSTFQTTSGRPWIVNPLDAPTWVWGASAVPALLVTILLYLDQNITVRLVNNPMYKLKKGAGYHLDLALVAVLVGVCSIFGLPWMVAATVRSLNHVRSLASVETSSGAHGATEEHITGVLETRISALGVHVAVGVSLLFLGVLQLVPMSVLFGLFLFMGVASMGGNQLFERLRLFVMDPALFPTTSYLRAVPTRTVHKFTLIQTAALAVLWVVKTSAVGILFPLFIALLAPVRLIMGKYFKAEHLALLDAEELPEEEETRETE
ncbi:MAG: HCO3- transporter [Deltaproteobacteria bacterium]|nr:HCO3- transporter [Deltaproteobacteria bacterium]